MATKNSSLKDSLVYYKKKLEKATEEESILRTIHKMSKVPITLDLLQGTGAGKILRVMSKKPGTVGHKASSLLNKWRYTVADFQKSSEHSNQNGVNLHSENNVYDKYRIKEKNKHSNVEHSKEKVHKDKHLTHKDVKNKHSKDKHVKEKSKNSISHSKDLNGSSKTSEHYSKEKEKNHSHNFSKSFSSEDKYKISHKSTYDPESPELLVNHPKSSKDRHLKIDTPEYEPTSKKIKIEIESSNYSSPKSEIIKTKHTGSNKNEKTASLHSQKNLKMHIKHSEKSSNDKKTAIKLPEKQSIKSSKKLLKIQITEAFTSSEATFEDCLSFNDLVPRKKKKSSKSQSSSLNIPVKKNKFIKTENIDFKNNLESPKNISENRIFHKEISELSQNKQIPKNDVDFLSTLPQTQPNYRPLPQRNYDYIPVKKKVMSNEEAIKFTSSRKEKTAVYSGRKNIGLTEVPTLFECATRTLIDHIDVIEYMGVIPFYLLESMLKRCTAQQLFRIENYNPYLLEDTNELWAVHCKRDYRTAKRQENETWRELYWRTHDEQEQRLRNVTANISASIANSNPVRKAKLAYIDMAVKPPRDVARRQAKHGTGLPTNIVKPGSPSKVSPKPVAPAVSATITATTTAATTPAIVIPSHRNREVKPQKPKIAPLMAKTLKSMKKCFRR